MKSLWKGKLTTHVRRGDSFDSRAPLAPKLDHSHDLTLRFELLGYFCVIYQRNFACMQIQQGELS